MLRLMPALCLVSCRGAGTDANVFIQIYGDAGTLGPCRLETGANNFERNQRDEFLLKKSTHVGKVQKVVVWHDASGLGADWHLATVEIAGPGLLGPPPGPAAAAAVPGAPGAPPTGAASILPPHAQQQQQQQVFLGPDGRPLPLAQQQQLPQQPQQQLGYLGPDGRPLPPAQQQQMQQQQVFLGPDGRPLPPSQQQQMQQQQHVFLGPDGRPLPPAQQQQMQQQMAYPQQYPQQQQQQVLLGPDGQPLPPAQQQQQQGPPPEPVLWMEPQKLVLPVHRWLRREGKAGVDSARVELVPGEWGDLRSETRLRIDQITSVTWMISRLLTACMVSHIGQRNPVCCCSVAPQAWLGRALMRAWCPTK
jgi:hypothetical protein